MADPNLTSESESEHPHLQHPILDWSASLVLLALFIAALIYFPPVSASANPPAVSQWMLFFGRFHPIFVHLPIGVMIMAIAMEIITMAKHRVANALRPAVTFILWCGVFGLITAVTFGILLSREGGFDTATIQAHQTLGIAATIAAFLALFTKLLADGTGKGTFLYRTFLVVSFLILSVGAHFGGNMSHGDNYLTEYAPPAWRHLVKEYEGKLLAEFTPPAAPDQDPSNKPPKPIIAPAKILPGGLTNKTVFVALVSPILEKKCSSCHNATKPKGKLRMDTYELLIKGGENGNTVVPGDPDKSLLLSRIALPKDDDDHMPPSGKDPISADEISLLSWWIKAGASKTMTVAEAHSKMPPELHPLEQTLLTGKKSGATGSTPPHLLIASAATAAQANPAVAEAMKKINGSGASLAPLAADPAQLRFTALNVARDYTDENLKDLTPILENIVALDLAKTKITDGSITLIAKMPNLRELHLENTAVTDAGVAQLKALGKLEYLNLYGTKVTDKALDVVGEIASLKSLYLWQTGVTKPKADAFKAAHPAINLNIGWSEADAAKVVATTTAPAPKPEAKPVLAPAATVAAAKTPAAASKSAEAPKPAAASNPQSLAPGKPLDPNTVVFKNVIMPILEEKCIACHGPKKSKGKLRMDSYAALLKGGSDGADTVIPSKPVDSLMVKRTALPVDDDDHMPPKDEKQLSKDEIALLKWWVETGASETATLVSLKKTPEIDTALTAFAAAPHAKGAPSETASKEGEKPKAKPLTPEEKKTVASVTAKMTALNASLMPLALDTELLRFSCVNGADKISDKELALLEPAAAWIVWVDLGKTKVTDAGLASIAKMKNLEKLHLEKTAVTDAGLASLSGLPHLEYLNLYGTKVTDAGIAKLAPDKGLKKLFVWESGVTHEGAKKLEAAVPGLSVNVGLSEADIAKLIEQNKPPEPPPAPKKAAAKPAAPAPATKPVAPAPAKPAAPVPAKPAATTPATPKPDDKK